MKTYRSYTVMMIACLLPENEYSRDMVNMILDYAKDRSIPAKAKLNINDQDNNGNTCLHFAALRDNVKLCRVLIEVEKANPLLTNFFG